MEVGLYSVPVERDLRGVVSRKVYQVDADSPEVIVSKEEKRPRVNAIKIRYNGANYLVAKPDCDVLTIVPTAKLIEDRELSDTIRSLVPNK
jgi:hypothetical protein